MNKKIILFMPFAILIIMTFLIFIVPKLFVTLASPIFGKYYSYSVVSALNFSRKFRYNFRSPYFLGANFGEGLNFSSFFLGFDYRTFSAIEQAEQKSELLFFSDVSYVHVSGRISHKDTAFSEEMRKKNLFENFNNIIKRGKNYYVIDRNLSKIYKNQKQHGVYIRTNFGLGFRLTGYFSREDAGTVSPQQFEDKISRNLGKVADIIEDFLILEDRQDIHAEEAV